CIHLSRIFFFPGGQSDVKHVSTFHRRGSPSGMVPASYLALLPFQTRIVYGFPHGFASRFPLIFPAPVFQTIGQQVFPVLCHHYSSKIIELKTLKQDILAYYSFLIPVFCISSRIDGLYLFMDPSIALHQQATAPLLLSHPLLSGHCVPADMILITLDL